jgi:hypothetical protein
MAPIIQGVNITLESLSVPGSVGNFYLDNRQVFFFFFNSKIDTIPNTRPEDEFLTYPQYRFVAPYFEFYRDEPFAYSTQRSVLVTMSNKDRQQTQTLSFLLFYSSTYCCSSGK